MNIKVANILFIWLCICLYNPKLSSQFGVQQWNTENGLSNNWVSDIIQDHQGYLWVGTQYGLNKFDGYSFQTFRYQPNQKNSLNANWVKSLSIDQQGDIWIGVNYGGVNKINPETGEIRDISVENKSEAKPKKVLDLHCDQLNNIWIGCAEGLYFKSSQMDTFSKWNSQSTYTISEGTDRSVFVWNEDYVLRYLPEESQADTVLDLSNTHIRQIAAENSQSFWVIRDDNIYFYQFNQNKWEGKQVIEGSFENFNPFYQPLLQRSGEDVLWIGSDEGMIQYNIRKETGSLQPMAVAKNGQLLSLFIDNNDNQWIGTSEGLILQSSQKNKFLQDNNFRSLPTIKGVRESLQYEDHLYVANTEGLFLIDLSASPYIIKKILSQSIFTLYLDRNNQILAGGQKLYKIDPENLDMNEIYLDEKNKSIWSISEDWGGHLWVSSTLGLYRQDSKTEKISRIDDKNNASLFSCPNQNTLVDKQGRLWVGTIESGIYILPSPHLIQEEESPEFIQIRYEEDHINSLTSNLTTYLTEDADGFIWAGTDAGLNKIDPRDFSVIRYLQEDGLTDEKIMALVFDDKGFLWGSTVGHGLFRLDPKTEVFNFYNRKDGLVNNNYLLSSVFKNSEGLLFFGSNDILQIFHPDNIEDVDKPGSPFFFTQAVVSGEPENRFNYIIDDHLELKHKQLPFTIQFTTLNYYEASETEYFYKLSGVHQDWQSNGSQRQIVFNSLDPGKYNLQVKAVNPDIQLSQDTINLEISIAPPWWKSWWAMLIYCFGLMAILYAIYRFRLHQRIQKLEAARLKELDNFKTRFFTNITHELRTPLTIINGEAQRLKRYQSSEIQAKGNLIYHNGRKLLDMINQMLDLSRLESGKLTLQLQHGDIVILLSYLLGSFQTLADGKNIRLHFLTPLDEFYMDHDPEKIRHIVSNLLSNAVKFTPDGGDIYLILNVDNGRAIIEVKDNGIGIKEEILPLIFDRYFQAESNPGSSGIGLSYTNELVKILNGDLTVKSTYGKGSSFFVSLPVNNDMDIPDQGIQTSDSSLVITDNSDEGRINKEVGRQQAQVLIVEDNDDVRQFLVSSLIDQYQVIQAKDGMAGLGKAKEKIPDIIVSDVMMPGINGLELCQKLKEGALTSHIPIILLTAKADFDSRMEGLKKGADAYLEKPFEESELLLRIQKLLELRSKLQNKYQTQNVANPTEEVEQDEFLLKARSLVEKHLGDSNFGIPQLCRELGVSRTHLHRKLKALTGQSTSIFIRHIKLQNAHQLLNENQLNVSEVAYQVGFNDPSYFSRLYSETFGFSPSETYN